MDLSDHHISAESLDLSEAEQEHAKALESLETQVETLSSRSEEHTSELQSH